MLCPTPACENEYLILWDTTCLHALYDTTYTLALFTSIKITKTEF